MSVKLTSSRLEKLKEEYGEAFYILDSEQFKGNFKELKASFSSIYPNFNIAYSYKTNYTPKLCSIVNELKGYAEVVSEMELELALRLGVEYKDIIWNGPVKKSDIVEDYLLNGGVVNVDSLEEVKSIQAIINKHPDIVVRLGVRCNYDVGDGVISRFGFDIDGDDFKQAMSFIKLSRNVELVSLQCHFAKRQLDYWPSRVNGMIGLIDRLGFIPQRIDLGGAMFGKMDESLKSQFSTQIPSYDDYANVVATAFKDRFGDNGPELVIEPGSALVGDCMKFVGTVKTIKSVRGRYIATVLGSQKNISMAGVNPPLEVVSGGGMQHAYEAIDIVGYTCIEGDILYKNYKGEIAVGDSMVISNCGSYSLVMKPPFILPNFPVIDICGQEVEVLKRAETFDDIFQSFIMEK